MLTFIVLSHCGIKSKSFYLIPPQSHYIDTGATSPSPTMKIGVPSIYIYNTIVDSFGMSRHVIEHVTSRYRSRHSTYCATEASL